MDLKNWNFKSVNNQKGISLVEVLAALALVATIAAIAWTALSIGFKHTAVETEKTKLQQSANLIMTTLTNEHRRSEKYSLLFEGNQLKINSCDKTGACSVTTIDQTYDYTGTVVNTTVIDSHDSVVDEVLDLKPKAAHTKITLVLTDLNNPNNKVTLDTKLTRIITQ
ncbi:prepilin-type N-terminal cleavage/methylation domain-containing protein [Planococcus sp. FY231025]|uniref:prepilin-type N-terminal cleavage/methylation domain-containing protein n=1 Tax=Planococcus sp. FY231025 TaxID=3455699 RepID=UPI003F8FFC3F